MLLLGRKRSCQKRKSTRTESLFFGGKLKKNGKHHIDKVGKGGKATVDANVKGRKVASMSLVAEGKEITGRKIKSKKKMALSITPQVMSVATNSEAIQLAQLDWYSGCYFLYDDDDDYYYWFDAEDVYGRKTLYW